MCVCVCVFVCVCVCVCVHLDRDINEESSLIWLLIILEGCRVFVGKCNVITSGRGKASYICMLCGDVSALTGRLLTYQHTYIQTNRISIEFTSTTSTVTGNKLPPDHRSEGYRDQNLQPHGSGYYPDEWPRK